MGYFSIPVEFYIALPYVVAFSLPILMVIALVLQYKFARSVTSDLRLKIVFIAIATGALITVLLTPRSLNEKDLETAGRVFYSDYEDGFSASRYISLFLVGASFVELIRGWLASRVSGVLDPARAIIIGLVTFYVGTIFIQALGSEYTDFSYKSLYVPILLLAVYYQKIENLESLLITVKYCVFVLMIGSIAGIAIRPDFVLQQPAASFIPGINYRLFGLTSNANILGPIALVGILLELNSKSRSALLMMLRLICAVVVFVLAQSKTAWIAAFVIIIFVCVPLGLRPIGEPHRFGVRFRRATFTLLICLSVLAVAVPIIFIFDSALEFDKTTNVSTLSGRTAIWDITLEGWRQNILFGYGSGIWGPKRMKEFGLFHVGQAHNQFVQTLGDAGVVGFAALLTFLGALIYASLARFAISRGITLSILLVVLVRCITEAPLRSDSVLSWSTFTLVVLIALSCYFLRKNPNISLP